MTIRIQNSINLGGLLPPDVTTEALQAGADHLLAVAQEKAPLLVDVKRANRQEKPGTLRESGYARVLDDATAEIGFRDFIAAIEHEDMDVHHDIGQPKFLEDPMTTEKDRVLQVIADKLREGMRG